MLTTARVAIPNSVAARLRSEAAFNDDVNDYVREDLIGFKRPAAAAFALICPVALAFAYYGGGFGPLMQLTVVFAAIIVGGLYFVGKTEWPNIVSEFQAHALAKKRAVADLRCGFGESSFLSNGRCPRYFEHDHGVLALIDIGDFKTMFFDISNDGTDPRWALYTEGELNRRVWRWLRLPVSREVVSFTTEGSKLASAGDAPVIDSIDAWEAVNVSLGEPLDGAVIHRPLDELVDTVSRLV